MASITVVQEDRYECSLDECDNDRTPSTSVEGSYCSRNCADRANGRGLLNDIEQDHRFCWGCFRQRKEVEPVPDEARRGRGRITAEALTGFESLTEHAEMGPYGIECQCGSIDHDVPDWGQRETAPFHWYLTLASKQLVADGRRDSAIDIVTLADQLWTLSDDEWYPDEDESWDDVSPWDEDDLELAVGRALRA